MLFRRRRRAADAARSPNGAEAAEPPPARDRELAAVTSLSSALARARDVPSVARTLLEECFSLLGVDFAAVALVSDDGKQAEGIAARDRSGESAWWLEVSLDFEHEPSGIASAVYEGAPVVVYDIAGSAGVNRRLAEKVGAKSAAFVPLVSGEQVPAVLVIATSEPKIFTSEELALIQALAAEAALALERTRSADALAEALERERLVASIGRKVRSELDLEAVLRVAVEETGKAAGVTRCFIRLGELGGPMPIRAEWDAEGFVPIGFSSERLPVSNLAAGEGRTVAVGDIREEPALDDPKLGGRQTLLDLDTVAVLATPILVFDRMIGIFGFHRSAPGPWSEAHVSLAEAVAREVAIAVHAAQLLEENARRLEQQTALLKAAQVVGSELHLDTVLQRLVVEVTNLLDADAADCYLHDTDRAVLRCAAVNGLDLALLELEFPAEQEIAGRFREPILHPAYEGFASAIAAPMTWSGKRRGFLGVATRDPERRFGKLESDLLETFAGLASLAVRNAASFEQGVRQARVQRGFYGIASALAEPLSQAATLDAVAQAASEALGGSFAAVLMPGGRGLELVASYQLPARLAEALGDAATDPRLVADDPVLSAGHSAYLGVPLIGMEGGLQGVLAVYARAPRAWREEEVEALSALAGNASAVLSNAELYQRVAMERERSYAILANIADGIVAVDRDDKVVLWNRSAEQITGVPATAALDRTPVEVLQRELAADDEGRLGERLLPVQRGGEEVWLSLTEAVMRDPVGAVAGRIFAFRDVSTERIVEEMKSGFVSTVSHELRATLTSIYGFAETLLRQDVLFGEEERQTFLRYIASEAQRLTAIVDTLLSVARLEAGDLQVELEPTDVRSVVSEAVTSVRESAAVNEHGFVLDLPDEPLAASADREKLRQILANLLDNAVKFSPDGGTVTVEARRSSGHVEVRVVDEGPGIPEAERERIFSKFHRADSSVRGGGGVGLGLFIARGLVAAMGGRIWVDSAEGGGSSFAFELPLAAESGPGGD